MCATWIATCEYEDAGERLKDTQGQALTPAPLKLRLLICFPCFKQRKIDRMKEKKGRKAGREGGGGREEEMNSADSLQVKEADACNYPGEALPGPQPIHSSYCHPMSRGDEESHIRRCISR